VSVPKQGEIWWAETDEQRRPVLVVTRTEAVAVLTGISQLRGITNRLSIGFRAA
jgi:hypothetical protein